MSKKLKDLVKITMGQSPSSSKYNTNKKGVPLIQGNADLNNGVVNPKVYTTQITKKAEKGDIILTVRAPVGDIAITNIDCCIGRGVCAIKGDEFYYYLLENLKSKNIWKKYVQGTTIESINTNDLSNLKVRVPTNKNEIKKITVLLKKTDSKLRLMEQKNKKIKYDVKNYLLSNLFVENKEEDILSWDEKDLDNISSISTGNCDLKDNIEDGKYPFFVRSEKVERIDSYAYDGEAILIPGDGRVGEIFHYINGKFNYHQRVYKISDFKDVIGKYVYYYLQQYFLRHVHKYSVKATVDSLRLPIIKEMKIRYPSIKKQEKIVNILSCVDKKIELSNKQISLMKNYKKGLLQKMFI